MKYLLIIVIVFFVSCSPVKWLEKNRDEYCELLDCCPSEQTTTVTEIFRDTVEIEKPMPADTGLLNALFRCDSNNRVLQREIDTSTNDTVVRERIKKIYETKTIRDTTIHVKEVPVEKIVERKHVPWWYWTITGALLLTIAFLIFKTVFRKI